MGFRYIQEGITLLKWQDKLVMNCFNYSPLRRNDATCRMAIVFRGLSLCWIGRFDSARDSFCAEQKCTIQRKNVRPKTLISLHLFVNHPVKYKDTVVEIWVLLRHSVLDEHNQIIRCLTFRSNGNEKLRAVLATLEGQSLWPQGISQSR